MSLIRLVSPRKRNLFSGFFVASCFSGLLIPRPAGFSLRGVFCFTTAPGGVPAAEDGGSSVSVMNPNFIRTLSRNGSRNWLGLVSIFAGILLWYFITRYGGIPNFILPSPLSVWTRLLKALSDGSLIHHTSITLTEIVLGLLAGTVFATIVGYALAKSRSLERILSPYLVASQAIPVVAIAPLLVIWLGDGILSKVIICALIVFFPVLVNTIVGVRAVPTALYDLMNSLHASRSQILWKVEVPASLPVVLGGLRVGATLSVIGAIVGELVDAEEGLGFLLQLGDFQYDTPMVFVAVFMLVALALTLYGIVIMLEKRFLKWYQR